MNSFEFFPAVSESVPSRHVSRHGASAWKPTCRRPKTGNLIIFSHPSNPASCGIYSVVPPIVGLDQNQLGVDHFHWRRLIPLSNAILGRHYYVRPTLGNKHGSQNDQHANKNCHNQSCPDRSTQPHRATLTSTRRSRGPPENGTSLVPGNPDGVDRPARWSWVRFLDEIRRQHDLYPVL